MAWKKVTTTADHHCWICHQKIPAGTRCLSESKTDSSGNWHTSYMCPSLSCYLKPAERQKYLASPRPKQQPLF